MSRSTLQRRLAACGMSFTDVRRQAAVSIALGRLMSGASCASAARTVGLSVDHLCRLITAHVGLRPSEIARACELAERARRWRSSTPPRSGTRLYASRINGSGHPPRASALQYANVIALTHSTGATPLRDRSVDEPTFAYMLDGVEHRVWYMDSRAIADRLRIARAHGLLAGVWRLGGEDQALWSSPVV